MQEKHQHIINPLWERKYIKSTHKMWTHVRGLVSQVSGEQKLVFDTVQTLCYKLLSLDTKKKYLHYFSFLGIPVFSTELNKAAGGSLAWKKYISKLFYIFCTV